MSCISTMETHKDAFYNRLRYKVTTDRVPVNGSIELTGKCNFRCAHCYNDIQGRGNEELDTTQWKSILDQMTEAGTLFLLITGGEPLLRSDVVEIYEYAVKKGLIVTFFTNSSLVDEDLIDAFCKYPPRKVEITLYGASETTYEKITGKKGMFTQCLNKIQKLVENNIAVQLKSVVLQENVSELEAMKQLAADLGAQYRFDGAVFPRLNGDTAPVSKRLTPEQVVELNLSTEESCLQWRKLADQHQDLVMNDSLYSCGAAVSSFHIDAQGWMYPCLMVGDVKFSLQEGSFKEGWEVELPKLLKRKMNSDSKCRDCKNMIFCNYCPATFKLETGSEHKYSPFLCKIGELMAEKIYEKAHERV